MRPWLAACVAVVVCACLDPLGSPEVLRPGRSRGLWEENLRPGSSAWDNTNFGTPDSTLSAYGLPISLHHGDTLHIFVKASRPPLSVAVYRLGWYSGAGGRLIALHSGVRGLDQPACSLPVPGPPIFGWGGTAPFVVDPRG